MADFVLKQTASEVQKAIDNALNPDTTLTVSGKPADAKAVGDALASVNGGAVVGRFFGKRANFLGDSQTDNAGNYKSVFFYDWLKNILGLSETNSYGYSGTTIMPIAGQNCSFLERYSSMVDADLIVVWGGTNDYHYGHALGEVDDTVNTTFCGALNQLCKGLITKYPQKDILFVTPTPRGVISTAVAPLSDYADAIINVCAKYCIPVYDAFRKCNMPINYEYPRVHTVDGLHLNDLGHEVLGKSMANFILYSEMAGCRAAWGVSEGSGGGEDSGGEEDTNVAVTGVTISKTAHSLTVGGTVQLTATVKPSNATNTKVVWTASNGNCTVNNGLVTAVAVGDCVIIAISEDGGHNATCTVSVVAQTVPVTSVTLNHTALTLDVGDSQQLTATVLPANATNTSVVWSASNGNCTVANGLVTAVNAGNCIITATADGKSATCSVTVEAEAAPAPASPIDGKTVTYAAQASYPACSNLVLLLNADDFGNTSGDTFVFNMKYSNATQELTGFTKGMDVFPDETGEVSNGAYKTDGLASYLSTTVADGVVSATFNRSKTTNNYPYVKVSVPIKMAAYPVSFDVESITFTRNGEYIEILKVGSFWEPEGFSVGAGGGDSGGNGDSGTEEETAPVSPVDGKTVTYTAQASWPACSNFTLLVNAEDFGHTFGDQFEATIKYSNATQELSSFNLAATNPGGMQSFSDETGEVNNGKYKRGVSSYCVGVVEDGVITGTCHKGNDSYTEPYVKIPIPIAVAAYPVSFDVESVTLKKNGEYIPIQKIGGFYADEGFSAT